MLDGNMVAGTFRQGLLARVGKDRMRTALSQKGARQMEMNGRLMEGYVYHRRRGIDRKDRGGIARSRRLLRQDLAAEGGQSGVQTDKRKTEMKRLVVPVLAYVIPTFILGYVWHLVLFERYYADLAMYRADIIIPFGFASMLIQAVLFAWHMTAFLRDRVSEPRLEDFCLRILRSGIVLELHHAGGRGQERDVVGARLSGHRNGLYGRSVGSGRAIDGPGFRRLEARPAAGGRRRLKAAKQTVAVGKLTALCSPRASHSSQSSGLGASSIGGHRPVP